MGALVSHRRHRRRPRRHRHRRRPLRHRQRCCARFRRSRALRRAVRSRRLRRALQRRRPPRPAHADRRSHHLQRSARSPPPRRPDRRLHAHDRRRPEPPSRALRRHLQPDRGRPAHSGRGVQRHRPQPLRGPHDRRPDEGRRPGDVRSGELLRGVTECALRRAAGSSHGRPHVPYKEAIRKTVTQPARFKRQSGGHGQFGDVTLEIKPLPRGSGFRFENGIVGGVVPKQFIPVVEEGVSEYLKRGPLGFPLVDVAVKLVDGKHHDVDSSEMSFKTVGRMAMQEGAPKCDPVLLEPIVQVEIAVPSHYTNKVNALVSVRRGHILGFDARDRWPGWDVVTAHLPQVETRDLIIELRSLTAGVGTFTSKFDHLQELIGRRADEVIAAHTTEPHGLHAKA
ncbi:MAG: hypothetical protein EXQ93_03480 [Alphaproteobacteria bacterium]|nr:hypothetical protein [Alphaproteobacteria bacterium]